MSDGIQDNPEDVTIYDLEALDKLKHGSKGFQNEEGYEALDVDYALVPVVKCKSNAHPTPQWRFVSPYELDSDEPELEVADRLYCARIHGRPVIGRRDDLAQVAKEEGRSFANGISLEGLVRAGGWLGKLREKLLKGVGKVLG